jgi:hypothetical protein
MKAEATALTAKEADLPSVGRPGGLRWRLTGRMTAASRRARFERFMEIMRPGAEDRILDVGVIDTAWRASNFLEVNYPWRERITAVTLEEMSFFPAAFPEVPVVVADGRDLPFDDDQFDIGFSNAVIEHVGSRRDQARFVSEMVRTCRRVWISTPNARFPIDPHTLLPFVHWLPRRIRHPLLRWTGQGRWATEAMLNPLSADDLLGLFPAGEHVTLIRQRVLGLTSVLTAVTQGPPDRQPDRPTGRST